MKHVLESATILVVWATVVAALIAFGTLGSIPMALAFSYWASNSWLRNCGGVRGIRR